ncbi:hypothetical protein LDENG_00001110 [Lucifuga dentata]|nr:hypothetical protein LDENG_00001110 [Lucifuga dentata]
MSQPQSDHSAADEVTPVAITSDDMEEPLFEEEDGDVEEEEELVVLDPEHPLVRRQQAALKIQLSKELEKFKIALKKKHVTEKRYASQKQEVGVELFRVQQHLARLQDKLEVHHVNKAQAEAKRLQALDQLEVEKSQFSNTANQRSKANIYVSQLQTELDSLMQQVVYAQGVNEDLRSNVVAMMNATRKAGAEKTQAEDHKLKQDLYVERLTRDLEKLTEQIAMYEVQTSAQAMETQAAKDALSEADLELGSLVLARKQLFQQWNSCLLGMRKRDETFAAMQEAMRNVKHEVITLDGEIEDCKKSTMEEDETNEILTMQLNWLQLDAAATKKLMSQRQNQQESLQAQYSICLRTVQETEHTLTRLKKESNTYQDEVSSQRKQLEKESSVRLEVEGKIMAHIQQKLIHNKAAKYSKQLTNKIATLKMEKLCQLWQLENELTALGLDSSEISQHLDSLDSMVETMEQEITNYNKLLTASQAKMASFAKSIEHNHGVIDNYNRKIQQITASTGHEDLSPMQIKIASIATEIEEVSANIKRDRELWTKMQGMLIALTQERETTNKVREKLQTMYTALHQKKIRVGCQIELELREETDLRRHMKTLRGDMTKLSTLISKNRHLSQALEQQNALMETDNLQKLKEEERERVEMEMKREKIQEEKERLQDTLMEAESQIMLWERKIKLVKETRSAADGSQADIRIMKAEIQRMEVRLNQLKKQQERLLRESEATVVRREGIIWRKETLTHSSHKPTTKCELSRIIHSLQRKIKDTHEHVAECEEKIMEVRDNNDSLSDSLGQQQQQLMELSASSHALNDDILQLQDTKDRNLAHLVALQNRIKQLQMVREGRYQALSTSGSVETSLQSQKERVHAISTILHRVCEEFPQHQGVLRKLLLNLAARIQALEQELS